MASKSKRRVIVQKKAVNRKHHSPNKCQSNERCSVTKRAPTSQEECPMRFPVYLNGSNITGTFTALAVVWITNIILNLM